MLTSVCVRAAERTEIVFPGLSGYVTLKCDFHTHTVFSDGLVWPTVRVEEAWRSGLDALAISDHLEYLPHKADVSTDFNRPYEIAKPVADKHHIVLVRASEITRDEPHGHFNALFVTDCNALNVDNQEDAVRIANEQGAFVFWNHPEWKTKGEAAWSDIQQKYLEKGWMKGIEPFNAGDYYSTAHKWAVEKNLTILGNTDIHKPLDELYDYHNRQQRAMTLVFATEKSEAAIKEALLARRTVAFSRDMLLGEEQWVKPLFDLSVIVLNRDVVLRGKGEFMVGIHNSSSCPYILESNGKMEGFSYPLALRLPAGKTVMMQLQGDGSASGPAKLVSLPYSVKNVLTAPEKPLSVAFDLNVEFVP
jgi:hypothetical protein